MLCNAVQKSLSAAATAPNNAAGTLTLHGSQNFTGALNINAGTVVLGVNSTLATRQLTIADGSAFDASARGGYNLGAGGTLVVGRSFSTNDVIGNFTAMWNASGAAKTVGGLFPNDQNAGWAYRGLDR